MSATTHPTPTVHDLFWPCGLHASQRLLATPGLELTYQARGALLLACEEIARNSSVRTILLPAYHCPSGVTPALMAGLKPVYYRIRRDLSIDYDDLLKKADGATCAVLVIHFFGIEADLKPLSALRATGVRLIEDWSHSFLQGDLPELAGSRDSDYRIYSFWKLVPSGVGGGLVRSTARQYGETEHLAATPLRQRVVNFKQLLEAALEHGPRGFAQRAFTAIEALRLALRRGKQRTPTREALPEAITGESRYPVDRRLASSAMPSLARRIIASHDFAAVAQARRENFRRYAEQLVSRGPLKLLHSLLPDGACPWVFPVLLDGRDDIDHVWRAQGVALHTFGIYLHSSLFEHTDPATLDDARYLASHLLCLAIHQDISVAEVGRSVAIIQSSLTERG